MTLQLLRCTARTSLHGWWALAPPSHPCLPQGGGGCFLLHCSALAGGFLLGSRMLCVARTFLFCRKASATDRPTASSVLQRYGNKLNCRGGAACFFRPRPDLPEKGGGCFQPVASRICRLEKFFAAFRVLSVFAVRPRLLLAVTVLPFKMVLFFRYVIGVIGQTCVSAR